MTGDSLANARNQKNCPMTDLVIFVVNLYITNPVLFPLKNSRWNPLKGSTHFFKLSIGTGWTARVTLNE